MKSKSTSYPRPSRYGQNKSGYEMTCSGMVMGKAILAVRQAQAEYTDLAADAQEGADIPSDAWDVCAKRYTAARRKLDTARRKISNGQTCANRAR